MKAVRCLSGMLVMALLGCAQPEERYVLAGSLVDAEGQPVSGAEVRLLREASWDGIRCAPMTPLAQTVSGLGGEYRFELLLQQLTLGSPTRKVFRVEVTHPAGRAVVSMTFRFPAADLQLPPLAVLDEVAASALLPGGTLSTGNEEFVDGVLSWRSDDTRAGLLEDRPTQIRSLSREFATLRVDRDSFGSTEDVPLELRYESRSHTRPPGANRAPLSRGVSCNVGPAEGPCPLTDGRFLPWKPPPRTQELVLTFAAETRVDDLWFRGLLLEGEPRTLVVDWSPDTRGSWLPYRKAPLDLARMQLDRQSCTEPGSFLVFDVSVGGFPLPRQLRLRFVDSNQAPVSITSLAEISVSN